MSKMITIPVEILKWMPYGFSYRTVDASDLYGSAVSGDILVSY
jgi:hypothetical protein